VRTNSLGPPCPAGQISRWIAPTLRPSTVLSLASDLKSKVSRAVLRTFGAFIQMKSAIKSRHTVRRLARGRDRAVLRLAASRAACWNRNDSRGDGWIVAATRVYEYGFYRCAAGNR
jgi:hypothetical protein